MNRTVIPWGVCICSERSYQMFLGTQDTILLRYLAGEGSKSNRGKMLQVMCLLCLEKPDEENSRYQLWGMDCGPRNLTPRASLRI